MILQNDLYTITERHDSQENPYYTLRFNPECYIYKAHFPARPITPGVCLVQVAIEVLSDFMGCRLELSLAKNLKFLEVVCPSDTMELYITRVTEMDGERVAAQIVMQGANATFAKISIECKVQH